MIEYLCSFKTRLPCRLYRELGITFLPAFQNEEIMKTKKNEPKRPNDIGRTEEHNRADNMRPEDATMPRRVGSTDDMNTLQPRTTGSNEMATGNPIQPKDRDTARSTRSTNPNSEDIIGENAGGNFPINEDMPQGRNQRNQYGDDKEAVKESTREDVKKDTGTPTGAIHGSGDDIKSVPNDFDQPGNKKSGR